MRYQSRAIAPALLTVTLTIAAAGCASSPDTRPVAPSLAQARTAVAAAGADPAVTRYGGEAWASARAALQQAEHAAASGASVDEIRHLASLTSAHVQIAREQARRGQAAQGLEAPRVNASTSQTAPASELKHDALRAHRQAQSARETALAAQLAGATSSEVEQLTTELAALEIPNALTDRGLVLVLEDDLFMPGVAQARPQLTGKLAPVVSFLTQNPQRRVIIEGHTDDQLPLATSLRLSQARAESVRTALIREGVGGARIQARGFGADEPVASNESDSGRAQNRRVELVIIPGP